ncbi:MAG: hypothetical protein WCW31_00385 [Patescibacteria group bacterium]|jgi:predicted RNA-binding Zn-ribbon protein involved in translation (DUF1610 family)
MIIDFIIDLILPLILGALITWIVSWFYYRKQNNEKPAWFTEESIKAILKQHPENFEWTSKQILDLYKNKIHKIDEKDDIPYGVCPECGSSAIKHSTYIDDEHDDIYDDHTCRKCGWTGKGNKN